MPSKKLLQMLPAVAAAVAIAFAAYAAGSGRADDGASQAAVPPRAGAAQDAGGRGPGGGGPGGPNATPVTGTTKAKVARAALNRQPGEIEGVFARSDGDGYVAMVVTDDGAMVMVEVSSDFEVTGTHQRPQRGPRPGDEDTPGTAPQPGAGSQSSQADGATSSTPL